MKNYLNLALFISLFIACSSIKQQKLMENPIIETNNETTEKTSKEAIDETISTKLANIKEPIVGNTLEVKKINLDESVEYVAPENDDSKENEDGKNKDDINPTIEYEAQTQTQIQTETIDTHHRNFAIVPPPNADEDEEEDQETSLIIKQKKYNSICEACSYLWYSFLYSCCENSFNKKKGKELEIELENSVELTTKNKNNYTLR